MAGMALILAAIGGGSVGGAGRCSPSEAVVKQEETFR
jgi:hypothetical protein